MLAFVKFGGSVITDKTVAEQPDRAIIQQLADEIRVALAAPTAPQLIIGHGSGSYGHTYAHRYGIHQGLAPDSDWFGYAQTAGAALRLNRIVVDALLAANLPAISLQPSSTLRAKGRQLITWETDSIRRALTHGMIPVIHGDVAFDDDQGSAIVSTEQLLSHLVTLPELSPTRIVLVGESGVYTADPRSNPQAERIPQIGPQNIAQVLAGTGDSHGIDVTGGMRSKIELMWQIVQAHPGTTVQLIGTAPGLLTRALLGQASGEGTIISAA